MRHILKHSTAGSAMTPETELLLMNASRAQLVREVIQPALAAGETVLCDRFYDSTVAYQGYGRGLDLVHVRSVIEIAVGATKPDLTLLLRVPVAVSELRRVARGTGQRDRFEEADREFFHRVERGYDAIAAAESDRVRVIDATRDIEAVAGDVWHQVRPLVEPKAASTRR
jgi:dTMP kinase